MSYRSTSSIPHNNTTNAKFNKRGNAHIRELKIISFHTSGAIMKTIFRTLNHALVTTKRKKNTSATSSTTILKEDQYHLKLGHWLNYL